MSFLGEIRYNETLVLYNNLKKEADKTRQFRIDLNIRLKERGTSREYRARLNKELIIIKANLDTKTEERNKAEIIKLKKE